jgi:HEAT repeat protein
VAWRINADYSCVSTFRIFFSYRPTAIRSARLEDFSMDSHQSEDKSSQAGPMPPSQPSTSRLYLWIGLLILVVALLYGGTTMWVRTNPAGGRDSLATAIDRLSAPTPSDRVAALRQLAQFGLADASRAIPAAVQAVGDKDADVRAEAVQSLEGLGSYAVYDSLSGTKGTKTDGASVAAVNATLFTVLAKDEQATVRALAARALGSISATKPASPKAGPRQKKGQDGNAASTPAPIAAPVEIDQVIAALDTALGDRDVNVRAAAAAALGRTGPLISKEPIAPLRKALEDKSAAVRAAALMAVANFGAGLDPIVQTLIKQAEPDDPAVREACAKALQELKPPAVTSASVPALVAGLRNPDREVRLQVVNLLSRLGRDSKDAIPGLIATLKEPLDSDNVGVGGFGGSAVSSYSGPAIEAARLLGEIAPDSASAATAIMALTEVVKAGPAKRRTAAADALARFGPAAAGAIPALITMLKNSDADESIPVNHDGQAAATAIGRIAPESPATDAALSALKDALHSKVPATRSAAVAAFSRFGEKAAKLVPEIQTLRDDPDPGVRNATSKALDSLEKRDKPADPDDSE